LEAKGNFKHSLILRENENKNNLKTLLHEQLDI